jgi:predicted permease
MSIRSWLERRRRLDLDEQDFQDEIRVHLAMAERDRLAEGADRQTARQASLKEFGNLTLATEAARQVWTPWWLEAARNVLSDVRYGLRALARNPAFSVTVVGVLTLGIGLNALVFTMLKGMALTPLSGVEHSARLAVIYGETTPGHEERISYPDYQQLRDHDAAFSQVMGSSVIVAGLGRGWGSRPIWGELVTGNYFQVLGVHAERGRTILPSDEVAPSGHPVAVLSDALWRSDFGADPGIVGKPIEVNHYALTVVGVADPSFHGTIVGYEVEVFIPIMMTAEVGVTDGLPGPTTSARILSDPSAQVLFPQGFLRPGTTVPNAAAATAGLWATLVQGRSPEATAERLRVVSFAQSPTGGQTYLLPSLMVLSAMGLLVLAIACANIAGLVVVRGLSRQGEIALRLALGASRRRIVRLLVVENLVLAVPSAILGVFVAARGVQMFVDYGETLAAPQRLFFNMNVDGLVVAFAVLVGCGCAWVFGFVPALRGSRIDLVTVMNDASPRNSARGRLRAGLVVAQVAVSLLLLVGAALVTRSLEAARTANPGFDTAQVASVSIDLRENGYDEARGRQFYRRLLDLARAEPGVDSATLAALSPMGLVDTRVERVAIEGYAPQRDEALAFMYNTVGPAYFRTLRIGLPAGREFEDRDDLTGGPVAIVNATLAERFWGSAGRALGHRLRLGTGPWRTIVGVAADVKYSRINEAPRPYVYVPGLQSYLSLMILHTRGPGSVDRLVDRARAAVVAIDPDLPILYARPLAQQIQGALFLFNLTAAMLFVFGVAGLALAALGTYGLVSYAVRQSTREIGIRLALGASRRAVVMSFAARGLRLGGLGTAIGLAAALGAGQLMRRALFGVTPTDPIAFGRALLVILVGVVLATVVPAWRAARTDPIEALRHQ